MKKPLIPGVTGWQKLSVFAATGFGLGLAAPIAPGTVGSLPGVVLALWTTQQTPVLQILVCLGMTFLAVPICDVAERVLGKKDDGRICADEWMLFPICVIGLPLAQHLWLLPVCFVVARVCDIIKPPPARQLQAVHGGIGIVIDDFFASLYALAVNHALFWAVRSFL
ncbi:MAG: phosphatidylglycerophosphatase A [Verrucomicrobiota bacterium]|jgi:phosphatidylglycerophosphatase A|nr:phosphatidylglycerophosphatase A [Verrucomicrobiota bacterium]